MDRQWTATLLNIALVRGEAAVMARSIAAEIE
jgi:hypothetical protein